MINEEKLGSYETIIKIERISRRTDKNNKEIIIILADDKKYYSHYINERNNGWENYLEKGVVIKVYVRPKRDKKYPERCFLNIFPCYSSLKPLEY